MTAEYTAAAANTTPSPGSEDVEHHRQRHRVLRGGQVDRLLDQVPAVREGQRHSSAQMGFDKGSTTWKSGSVPAPSWPASIISPGMEIIN